MAFSGHDGLTQRYTPTVARPDRRHSPPLAQVANSWGGSWGIIPCRELGIMILYIHGFLSAPQSFKAKLVAARLAELGLPDAFACPKLTGEPGEIIDLLDRTVKAARDEPALIGSSLGGFYATHIAERYGLRTVLLNPAVRPYELLHDYLGVQRNLYTGEDIVVEARHLEALRALDVATISDPSRYFLIATTGDEVLDYRWAVKKYRGSRQLVIEGGDHSLDTFPAHLDDALRFCGVPVPPC
jgi:predicted esterase YcpF (UPF0227 family)